MFYGFHPAAEGDVFKISCAGKRSISDDLNAVGNGDFGQLTVGLRNAAQTKCLLAYFFNGIAQRNIGYVLTFLKSVFAYIRHAVPDNDMLDIIA